MNIIEFSTREDYLLSKEEQPIPIKLNIPEWYKKLKHTKDNLTVKGCIPFMESLTTGYLLKLPQDINVRFNLEFTNEKTKEKKLDTFIEYALQKDEGCFNYGNKERLNLNFGLPQMHDTQQLEGSPLLNKHLNYCVPKIVNPWIIKTPPGYSCLFLPPLNNADDRFSIIPAIVETDVYNNYINFPYIINGDKYKTLDTILKKGTPYVQIIPFKKESWKMKVKKLNPQETIENEFKIKTHFLYAYKNFFWKKKTWE
jgi:hypothetical protein